MMNTNSTDESTTRKIVVLHIAETLDQRWAEWFAPLTVTLVDSGGTQISGELLDQSALHGILNRLRDMNLTILSVNVTEIDAT